MVAAGVSRRDFWRSVIGGVLETWEAVQVEHGDSMKWEYHFYPGGSGRDFEQAEEAMNNLGRTGWELVTTYTEASAATTKVAQLILF